MNRERNEGSRKQHMKDHRKEREGSQAADDRDRRPQHMGAKAIKTQGIRESEARMQIRELRSRYG